MTEIFTRRSFAVLLACWSIACSRDAASSERGRAAHSSTARASNSAAGAIDLGGSGYKPGPLTAVGGIHGTVKLDGPAPTATTPITVDEKVCGTEVANPVDATSNGLADVIVWVADAKTGKPLPAERRFELSSEKCALDPRVQAAVVGSTVNVFNDDKTIHRLAFLSAADGDTIQKMPFFNDGQVVASDKLAQRAGMVEVRCAQHLWTRAFIAVFDHPYFAVTERDGTFKIDSLPPGKYTVNVWHEGMKQPATQHVQIDANGTATLNLAVKLQ